MRSNELGFKGVKQTDITRARSNNEERKRYKIKCKNSNITSVVF